MHVDTVKDQSSFVIDGAKREDEGNYRIVVTNPSGEDSATLYVKVVGKEMVKIHIYKLEL